MIFCLKSDLVNKILNQNVWKKSSVASSRYPTAVQAAKTFTGNCPHTYVLSEHISRDCCWGQSSGFLPLFHLGGGPSCAAPHSWEQGTRWLKQKIYKVVKDTFFNDIKVPASLAQQRTLGRQAPFILASNVFFKPFLLSSFSLLAYSPLLPWNAVCDGTEILTSRSFSPPSLVIRMNLNMKREIQFLNFFWTDIYANIFNLLQIFCRYVCPVDILHQLWGLVKLASCTVTHGQGGGDGGGIPPCMWSNLM